MRSSPPSRARGFTLVELLVVMGIIAILASITLGVSGYVQRRAGASRAQAEIAALSGALDKYKMDNGIYPVPPNTGQMTPGAQTNGQVSPYSYTNNAAFLYQALSGKTNYVANTQPAGPVYFEFTPNQLTTNAVGTSDYATDPFGYPYGYVADDPSGTVTNVVFNKGFFDLWSTRGQSGTGSQTNASQFIGNWGAP